MVKSKKDTLLEKIKKIIDLEKKLKVGFNETFYEPGYLEYKNKMNKLENKIKYYSDPDYYIYDSTYLIITIVFYILLGLTSFGIFVFGDYIENYFKSSLSLYLIIFLTPIIIEFVKSIICRICFKNIIDENTIDSDSFIMTF